MNAEETKRWKAKNLRYKKPMVKELNLDTIREKLFDIQGECEEVRWYTDSEDGEDSLLNALDGNEDEVYEFKVAFAYLCEECEAMQVDLNEEWIPECFDLLFVVAGAGDQFGGLLGYDSYEGDYFGINCMDAWAEDEAKNTTLLEYAIFVGGQQLFPDMDKKELEQLYLFYYQKIQSNKLK